MLTAFLVAEATPSGIQQILDDLQQAYGDEEQDTQGDALQRFFSLHRGNGSPTATTITDCKM